MSQQTVLILGDSFVSRLDSYLYNHSVRNFNLYYAGHRVFCYGRGGLKIGDLFSCEIFDVIEQISPTVVLLEVGSNDLDNGYMPTSTLLQDLSNFSMTLKNTYGVSVVAVMCLFFRTTVSRGDWANVDALNDAIYDFNVRCKTMSMYAPFRHWHHVGLVSNWWQYISGDGVHLNATGLHKFYKSVRSAIIHFSSLSSHLQ